MGRKIGIVGDDDEVLLRVQGTFSNMQAGAYISKK
jgi:hypothetical protein